MFKQKLFRYVTLHNSLLWLIAAFFILAMSESILGQRSLPRIARPTLAQGMPPSLPQIEPSVIKIPIEANLEGLPAEIDAQVPRVIAEDSGGDCASEFGIYKRQPVSLDVSGNQVKITLGIEYRIKIKAKVTLICTAPASCGYGEPAPRTDISSTSAFSWDSPNWGVKSATDINVNFLDPCNLTIFDIDATKFVKDKVNDFPAVKGIANRINEKIQQQIGDLKTKAESAWTLFQQPINLGSSAWLIMNPESIGASSIKGSGKNISTSVRLMARPKVIIGQKPSGTNVPLPALEVSDTSGNGFHVALESLLYFDKASQIIESKLINKQYPVIGGNVKIVGVTVSGAGENVVLKVRIKGALNGAVYLIGKIALDAGKNELSTSDLRFTVETQEALGQDYQEILNDPAFLKDLSDEAKWQFTDELQDAKSKLQKALNKKYGDVQMKGEILALRPIGVYAGKDGFQSIIIADGNAEIQIQ